MSAMVRVFRLGHRDRAASFALAVLLAFVVAGGVLLRAAADERDEVAVAFSHQNESRAPHCQIGVPVPAPSGSATPVDEVALPATPDAGAAVESSSVLPGLSLRIEAAAANNELSEYGMPYPLRLFTLNLPPAGQPAGDVGAKECRLGYILLYVLSGQIEFAHHPGGEDGDLGDSGAVTYVRSGDPGETPLEIGKTVVLEPGDSIFLERAVFSFQNAGSVEAQLLGAASTPEWLPCAGGGCS